MELTLEDKQTLAKKLVDYMVENAVALAHAKVVAHRCVRAFESNPTIISLAKVGDKAKEVDAGRIIVATFLESEIGNVMDLESPSSSEVREAVYRLYDYELQEIERSS